MSTELDTAMASVGVSVDRHEPLSPGQGGFVIQFRAPADVNESHFTGRIEHVASGEVAHFQTPEQLTAFVRRVLSGHRLEGKSQGS